MSRVVEATNIVAAALVVIDTLHQQVAIFEEHRRFTRIPNTMRLVQKSSKIAAALS